MSYYEPQDNLTGPDPSEDDPTVRTREIVVTVKIHMVSEFSNRDADDAIDKINADIDAMLSVGGFRNADINVECY